MINIIDVRAEECPGEPNRKKYKWMYSMQEMVRSLYAVADGAR